MRSAIQGCLMVGSLMGIVITDRLLVRVKPFVLLAFAAAACAVSYVAWLWAPGPASSGGLMFLVGLFSAPLYPLAHAHAYRALPGQSGMVNALSHLFGPASLVLPLTLGLVADHFGIVVALLLLTAQPLGLLAIALVEHHRRSAARTASSSGGSSSSCSPGALRGNGRRARHAA